LIPKLSDSRKPARLVVRLLRSNGMRTAEWIHIVVFSFFVALACVRALPRRRRTKAIGSGVLGVGVTLTGAFLLPRLLPPLVVSVLRDWLPAALILLVYRQTGEFFVRIDQRFQDRLERIDERIAAPLLRWLSRCPARNWIAASLELAYLLCYPMIPMSFGTLYLLRLTQHADHFWVVVLISAYLSYGVLPFLQTLPPRMLAEPWLPVLPHNRVRALNLWILRHASIQVNTFPSAHVAASTGAALVLLALAPWPIGLAFVTSAAAIAVGTFTGRYHFSSDAIAGSAVAIIVFLAARWFGPS